LRTYELFHSVKTRKISGAAVNFLWYFMISQGFAYSQTFAVKEEIRNQWLALNFLWFICIKLGVANIQTFSYSKDMKNQYCGSQLFVVFYDKPGISVFANYFIQ